MELKETVVCRTGYCQHCYDSIRPKMKDIVLLYGTKSNRYKVYYVQRPPHNRGYVPFNYVYEKTIANRDVVGWRFCSIYGCGVKWAKENDVWKYVPDHQRYERFMISLEDWKALIYFKDFDYFI